VLGAVLPGRRTPWVAIVLTTAVAMGLTLIGDLGDLANIVVLLLLLVFLSTNVAVLVLRRDRVAEDHFTAPVVVPVLAIGSCLLLLWQQEAATWLRAGLMLLVGVGLYLLAQAPWWRGDRSRGGARSSAG
jgi:amino acid transporter